MCFFCLHICVYHLGTYNAMQLSLFCECVCCCLRICRRASFSSFFPHTLTPRWSQTHSVTDQRTGRGVKTHCTYIHQYIQPWLYPYMHTCIHTCRHTHTHLYIPTHPYNHTCMRICINTHVKIRVRHNVGSL